MVNSQNENEKFEWVEKGVFVLWLISKFINMADCVENDLELLLSKQLMNFRIEIDFLILWKYRILAAMDAEDVVYYPAYHWGNPRFNFITI